MFLYKITSVTHKKYGNYLHLEHLRTKLCFQTYLNFRHKSFEMHLIHFYCTFFFIINKHLFFVLKIIVFCFIKFNFFCKKWCLWYLFFWKYMYYLDSFLSITTSTVSLLWLIIENNLGFGYFLNKHILKIYKKKKVKLRFWNFFVKNSVKMLNNKIILFK